MPEAKDCFSRLVSHAKETAVLQSVEELLNWDQRTQMPVKAAEYRAEQITLLSSMIHERMTDPRRGEWLEELKGDNDTASNSDSAVIVNRLYKQFHKESKVPTALVEELSKTRVLAHQSWIEARAQNDFSLFSDHLKQIVRLLKEKTEAIGYETCPYDVLLDDYEPEALAGEVTDVFSNLKHELVPLIEAIQTSAKQPNREILQRAFAVDRQQQVGVAAAKAIGFDFEAGRLDVTHHPFCCNVGPRDCRMTTRYSETQFSSAFFGTLHETGHGLYEQGLRGDQYGLPTGEYCSLGIHESQSRLWENMVGRSLAFWKYFYPQLQQPFGDVLADVSTEDFFGAVNIVEPSLIRVEADEATYSLHIILRFELEQEVINGSLSVDDLPDAWREKYQQYLGTSSETDSDGVLQDVHWSEGLFGYFPTYALGNLYAAQFYRAAQQEIGDLDQLFEKGDFSPLLDWLRRNVHQVGKSLSATGILQQATGESLGHQAFMKYLSNKYSMIYDL